MNVNVLNKNLERVGVVMQYTSLIWDRRYRQNGDCELYLPSSMGMINLLQKDYYLTRDDDDMVCVIRKIEITTDAEQGNMLIVTGVDVRCLIDQRIQQVPGKMTGWAAEAAIRQMVTWAVINPSSVDGSVNVMYKPNGNKLVQTKTNSALTDLITTEYGYGNAGDKIRELQAIFGWGGRMTLEQIDASGPYLVYETYKGADRSALVKFKPSNHNLKSSDYVDDMIGMKNVSYIIWKYGIDGTVQAGEGTQFYGDATGVDRFEQIIDKRSNTFEMSAAQVQSNFPGGEWRQQGPSGFWIYRKAPWSFTCPPGSLRKWIEANDPLAYTFQEVGGVVIATTPETIIATTIPGQTVSSIASDTKCWLYPIPYFLYLLGMAAEENTKHPEQITFTAEIIPDLTYKYKEDYWLGDLVTVENEFGISTVARITEVLESWDATGYNLEIKFNE